MSLTRFRFVALLAVALGSCWFGGQTFSEEKAKKPAAPDLDRLTEDNFSTIFEALQPPKVEPWKSIPWHVSVVEAARQAEKEGKPIFMWQADGWPLGCG
jgi:hypothetical protein